MNKQVIFTSEADHDVAAAYDWYEMREPGLGEEFLRCVEACVLMIQRQPYFFPIATNEFRRALVRRFPYEIFYEVMEEAIVVFSVFHCSQDPRKWHRRLNRKSQENEQ